MPRHICEPSGDLILFASFNKEMCSVMIQMVKTFTFTTANIGMLTSVHTEQILRCISSN